MPRRLIVASTAVFAVLAALAVVRSELWTYGADSGAFAQSILDAFGGMHNGTEGGTHFRFHFSPALALLWPLVAAGHSALPLQLLQAAACVASAPLLYLVLRPYLAEPLAERLALVLLIYPPLLGVAFAEFHELGLFPPLGLGLFLAADRRRWGWFALCAALICGLAEALCVELVVLGTVLAWVGTPAGRTRGTTVAWGLAAAAGLVTLACYYLVVAPALGGWRPSHFYHYPVGDPPALATAFRNPGRLGYLLEALAPLAFLPLRSRWSWLALPGFGIVLAANEPLVWRMGEHYPALWIPWLVVGAGFGLRHVARPARWVSAALVLSVLFLVAFDPLHVPHYLRPYHDLADARRALACVPPAAHFSTYDEWYSAVAAARPGAQTSLTGGVDYLVYADDLTSPEVPPGELAAGVAAGRYRVVCRFGPVRVYAVGNGTTRRYPS